VSDDGFLEMQAIEMNSRDPDRRLQWLKAFNEPISTLKIAPIDVINADEIRAALQQHRCQIEERADHIMLTFPEGTTRKEVLPRTLQCCFDIFFPDGFFIREIYIHQKQISYIYIPASHSEIE
jgi:hypothetical protein